MNVPPVPVTALVRTFPATLPRQVSAYAPFPDRVIIIEDMHAADGRTTCGAYLGDGPDLEHVGGRFLGPAAARDLLVPGCGPLREVDGFGDRLIWRLIHDSRFGMVSWDPASFFASLAFTFKHGGLWAVIFTDPNPDGGRWIDYHRSPVIFSPKTDGRIGVKFGPRKDPQPRDFDENGRQYEGRFLSLRDAASALSGQRVDDLASACRLFDIEPPPPGPATTDSLARRIGALRELYRAVREEAAPWP